MEVTPKTLREAEFREVKRSGGYLHEDVDVFIEEVAKGVEVLQERLRQAVERAQRAEAAASEVTGTDETLRRTLVLAQRTADLAVQEAREQAARILAGAEQQAQAMRAESEAEARRTRDDALASTQAELSALEAARARAQAEVDTLQRWASDERSMIVAGLREAADAVERAGVASPPPVHAPIEISSAPVVPAAALAAPDAEVAAGHGPTVDHGRAGDGGEPGPAGAATGEVGPPTMAWEPSAGEGHPTGADDAHPIGADDGHPTGEVPVVAGMRVGAGGVPIPGAHPGSPAEGGGPIDERAIDEFFDDPGFGDDDRRFGGRLRRRR